MKAKQVTLPETTDELLVMLVDAGEYGKTDKEMAAKLLDVGSPEYDRAVEMFGLLHDRGLVSGAKAWGAYIYRGVTQEGRDLIAAGREMAEAEKKSWWRDNISGFVVGALSTLAVEAVLWLIGRIF